MVPKGSFKTRSLPGSPGWVTSTQKDRLSERPLHKKHSFKPCWEPSLGLGGKTKRERKRLNLFLFYSHSHPPPSLGLAPSQWPAETGEDLWCAESTAVQFSHEPSFFGGGGSFPGLNFPAVLGFLVEDFGAQSEKSAACSCHLRVFPPDRVEAQRRKERKGLPWRRAAGLAVLPPGPQ